MPVVEWVMGLPVVAMWLLTFAWVGLLCTIAVWPLLTAPAREAEERALEVAIVAPAGWPELPEGWTPEDVEATLYDIEHAEGLLT